MSPLLPGATIGLLGGGQLGRMFALEARRLGYRVHTFEPTPDSPTGQISDQEFNFSYENEEALLRFAASVDVITYEFENIPAATLEKLSQHALLRPHWEILYISQNRRREKEFLSGKGFPVAPFAIIEKAVDLKSALLRLGTPCVLKTADFGYDGKGQMKIEHFREGEEEALWNQFNCSAGVLEKWISFEAELSVIVARDLDGNVRYFPPAHNVHRNHILDLSYAPSPFSDQIAREAVQIAEALAEKFSLIGILAVEMFLTKEGKLLINELAPRPHNSGHYTFDACITSQFEQQLRAVCGLPLGNTEMLSPVLMRNLLGDLWQGGTPDWQRLLQLPGLRLHLYGKSEARPGRKMGHYCVLAKNIEEAKAIDQKAQEILVRR